MVASDLSPAAVARARREAELRALNIAFGVSDMTSLAEIPDGSFDVVVALDNVFPHLTTPLLVKAAQAMRSKLNSSGMLIASIRDYDRIIEERPQVEGPAFYGTAGNRRIVHQVWDWIDEQRYAFHLYITLESNGAWISHHFKSEYRCLLRDELSSALQGAGFCEVRWIMPPESGFYQPLVLANKGGE